MKKITILIFLSLFLYGCGSSTMTTVKVNQPTQNSNDSLAVSSHSSQTSNNVQSSSSGGGSPMARAIDVSQMTADIEKAEKDYKANPKDEKARQALADAYFRRAFALTEAAQYRAALGDFRKGLKLAPDNKAAKDMHDQIIDIFKSINREPPKEGEEPAPMPVNGDTKSSSTTNPGAEERITFAKGETSKIVTGELKDYNDSKTFIIEVQKGQTLKTEQDKSDESLHYITAYVKNPAGAGVGDSDASCNNRREISPTEAGDYKIEVVECKKADPWKGSFKLKVSVN